ncbi:MAG: hypothetical protein JST54_09585 [Deltaproteobacteria bacterium]|nr:hypothetical protein [Deltaproteobacteria bacterium]
MKVRTFLGAVIAMAGSVWCTALAATAESPSPSSPTTDTTSPHHAGKHGTEKMAEMCPMAVSGTTVQATDVAGGVALDFKTTTGDVADLRNRVRQMAEMHNHMHGQDGMMGGSSAPAAGQGPGGQAKPMGDEKMAAEMKVMHAATASVEDIEGGARLTLKPKDPAQLQSLQAHAKEHAARMNREGCPMMHEMMNHPHG